MNTSEQLSKSEAAVINIMLQKQEANLVGMSWNYDTARRVFFGDGWPTPFKMWQAAAKYLAKGIGRARGFQEEATVQLRWKTEADIDVLRGDIDYPYHANQIFKVTAISDTKLKFTPVAPPW